jgi:hypothetical protein
VRKAEQTNVEETDHVRKEGDNGTKGVKVRKRKRDDSRMDKMKGIGKE